jgi:hypothetical protein
MARKLPPTSDSATFGGAGDLRHQRRVAACPWTTHSLTPGHLDMPRTKPDPAQMGGVLGAGIHNPPSPNAVLPPPPGDHCVFAPHRPGGAGLIHPPEAPPRVAAEGVGKQHAGDDMPPAGRPYSGVSPSTNTAGSTPKAAAIRMMLVKATLTSPRST